jgi:hypothetical protein
VACSEQGAENAGKVHLGTANETTIFIGYSGTQRNFVMLTPAIMILSVATQVLQVVNPMANENVPIERDFSSRIAGNATMREYAPSEVEVDKAITDSCSRGEDSYMPHPLPWFIIKLRLQKRPFTILVNGFCIGRTRHYSL